MNGGRGKESAIDSGRYIYVDAWLCRCCLLATLWDRVTVSQHYEEGEHRHEINAEQHEAQ